MPGAKPSGGRSTGSPAKPTALCGTCGDRCTAPPSTNWRWWTLGIHLEVCPPCRFPGAWREALVEQLPERLRQAQPAVPSFGLHRGERFVAYGAGLLGFHCGITEVVVPDLSWSYEHCFPEIHAVPLTPGSNWMSTRSSARSTPRSRPDPTWIRSRGGRVEQSAQCHRPGLRRRVGAAAPVPAARTRDLCHR